MTDQHEKVLRELIELANKQPQGPWMIVSDWHRYGVMQQNHPHERVVCTVNQCPVSLQGRNKNPVDYVGASQSTAEFIAAAKNAIEAITAMLDERERDHADAERYRHLRDNCSTIYGMYNGSEPTPGEAHLEWHWQQYTTEQFQGFDEHIDRDIDDLDCWNSGWRWT